MAKWEVEVWDGADGATLLLRDGSTCAALHSVKEANEIARKLNAFPEILAALKWCVKHLQLIALRDFPDSAEYESRFNSTAAGLAAIRNAEASNVYSPFRRH